jgi:hypothetical protein
VLVFLFFLLNPVPPPRNGRATSALAVNSCRFANVHDDDKGPADPLASTPDRTQGPSSVIRSFRISERVDDPLDVLYLVAHSLFLDERREHAHMEAPTLETIEHSWRRGASSSPAKLKRSSLKGENEIQGSLVTINEETKLLRE